MKHLFKKRKIFYVRTVLSYFSRRVPRVLALSLYLLPRNISPLFIPSVKLMIEKFILSHFFLHSISRHLLELLGRRAALDRRERKIRSRIHAALFETISSWKKKKRRFTQYVIWSDETFQSYVLFEIIFYRNFIYKLINRLQHILKLSHP